MSIKDHRNTNEISAEKDNRIDQAIFEAENEFAETGDYIDSDIAFAELENKYFDKYKVKIGSMVKDMLEEYDIEKLNPRPNPYAERLKNKR